MAKTMQLFLDLGDAITKGVALGDGRRWRLRYPSVVARELIDAGGGELSDLLISGHDRVPRLDDLAAGDYPRTRSFDGSAALLADVLEGIHPTRGGRFVGWLAAVLGADRVLLGQRPTLDQVDAMLHKALILAAEGFESAEVTFVIDLGSKAEMIQRYADGAPARVAVDRWSYLAAAPRRLELGLSCAFVDAADCAVAALPQELSIEAVGRVLLVDIGYFRTKLIISSLEGCEYQQEVEGLGVSDCVHRVLRDGQEQGLIEDELALMAALERSQSTIEVAGRRFEVAPIIEGVSKELEEELARAAERAVVELFNRQGEPCKAVAILGGGAALAGDRLVKRLNDGLGVEQSWVAEDTSFLLAESASRLSGP